MLSPIKYIVFDHVTMAVFRSIYHRRSSSIETWRLATSSCVLTTSSRYQTSVSLETCTRPTFTSRRLRGDCPSSGCQSRPSLTRCTPPRVTCKYQTLTRSTPSRVTCKSLSVCFWLGLLENICDCCGTDVGGFIDGYLLLHGAINVCLHTVQPDYAGRVQTRAIP